MAELGKSIEESSGAAGRKLVSECNHISPPPGLGDIVAIGANRGSTCADEMHPSKSGACTWKVKSETTDGSHWQPMCDEMAWKPTVNPTSKPIYAPTAVQTPKQTGLYDITTVLERECLAVGNPKGRRCDERESYQ